MLHRSMLRQLLIAISLGMFLPFICSMVMLYSCPHEAGLAYFPLVSAQCTGEFLGTLGLIITALPGIVVGFLTLFIFNWYASTGREIPLFDILSGDAQFLFFVVVIALVNVVVYWLLVRLFLKTYKIINGFDEAESEI